MSSVRSRRGFTLPATGTLVVLGAALCALWLGWDELCSRGWVPGVTPAMDQAMTRMQAVEALVKQGEEAVPVLVEAYRDADPKIRRSAILGLGRMGTDARSALEIVTEALRDPDSGVRTNAVHAFVSIVHDPEVVGTTIGRLLADSDGAVRGAAMQALQTTGPGTALPAAEALRDRPAAARRQALFILRSVAWNTAASDRRQVQADLRPAFELFLDDPDPGIRIEALMTVGPATLAQIRELLHADYASLDARSNQYPKQSVHAGLDAVVRFGPHAAELLPDLLAVLDHEQELEFNEKHSRPQGQPPILVPRSTPTCNALFRALRAMRTAAAPAVPKLLLRTGELQAAESRLAAADTLFEIGAAPDEVVPILLPLLALDANIHTWTRYQAAKLLAKVSPDEARRQVEQLLPLLEGPKDPDLNAAIVAVWGLASQAQSAVPALIRLLDDDNPASVEVVLRALAGIGPDAAPAVPVLLRQIADIPLDREHYLRGADRVVRALGKIGPASRPAVPRLLELLAAIEALKTGEDRRSPQNGIRRAIITALGSIGDASPEVLAALDSEIRGTGAVFPIDALRSLLLLTPDSPVLLADCLNRLADQESVQARIELMLAIGDSKADRRAGIAPLLDSLDDEAPTARAAAAMVLGKIGPPAHEAVAELRRMLADERNWPLLEPVPWMGTSLWEPDGDAPLAPRSVEAAVREALAKIERPEK